MQDPSMGWLGKLAEYGPVGLMLALTLLVLGYAFKKLFDRALDEAKATGPKLEAIERAVTSGFSQLSEEMRDLRHDLEMAIASGVPRRIMRENNELTPLPRKKP